MARAHKGEQCFNVFEQVVGRWFHAASCTTRKTANAKVRELKESGVDDAFMLSSRAKKPADVLAELNIHYVQSDARNTK